MKQVQRTSYPISAIRADFPILTETMNGQPLVYLDNAATTQKPDSVIERMTRFYQSEYATVRRGVYRLSADATSTYQAVREQVAQWINAPSADEIIFTKGTTEAINLVAASFMRPTLQPGDEILISGMEHHANIVPWQQVCMEKQAVLKVIPITDTGELDMTAYTALLSPQTKLVSVNIVSNALGTVNPVQEMIRLAHQNGTPVFLDGAQSAPHMAMDVQALDCDFYAFSGHKVYGPSSIGVLYGKMKHLEAMQPYQTGGDMIEWVTFEKTTFAKPPHKFEAGTPPIVEVIGLGEAIRYIQSIGFERIQQYEADLLQYATAQLMQIDGLQIIGRAQHKASVLSFVFDDIHSHDVGTLLDRQGIAVRAGHHCAQPLMARFNIPATTRASFALYNTTEEIDALAQGLHEVLKVFR